MPNPCTRSRFLIWQSFFSPVSRPFNGDRFAKIWIPRWDLLRISDTKNPPPRVGRYQRIPRASLKQRRHLGSAAKISSQGTYQRLDTELRLKVGPGLSGVARVDRVTWRLIKHWHFSDKLELHCSAIQTRAYWLRMLSGPDRAIVQRAWSSVLVHHAPYKSLVTHASKSLVLSAALTSFTIIIIFQKLDASPCPF